MTAAPYKYCFLFARQILLVVNRDAVTGYLISFFFEHGYADCSLLVPGFMQQVSDVLVHGVMRT